ncbi:hypothetical protein AKUH3B101J_04530 [Apilactobacillus kunkeei]|nr:hypothetical protein [Apilactobacillus kunkeei]MCK8620411.1 hypothetical protein [Apilactobacillus kunkeei]MCK8628758.1 hypothetical protein [Apilactobacillus kunkeei]MCK8633920.1 hypothetical protein [Apilactobacillus kunkeei]MCK8635896.1 hypothetical protein [Apilactobacillus kunkeei]CAI2578147.1 hypothetical protein AKUH3B104J_04530 [Apilactobacillus kunkeei]
MQKNNVFKLAIIFLLTLVISTATVILATSVHIPRFIAGIIAREVVEIDL